MTELEQLKAKLRARERKPGFAVNVEEIQRRIAELEAQQQP
jgi:hypothetical protein